MEESIKGYSSGGRRGNRKVTRVYLELELR